MSDEVAAALNAALTLVAEGKPVLPCAANKRPTCPGGFKAAAHDLASVLELWRQHPGELVGVSTGEASGLDVLDLDAKHEAAREWWIESRIRLPVTLTCRTRSGGLHLYFRHAQGLRCSTAKVTAGVDVRADGGYVIHWPSAGLPVLCDAPIAPWPEWLLDDLMPEPKAPARNAAASRTVVPNSHDLAGLVRVIVGAAEGQRNMTLFWAACRFGERVRSNLLRESDAAAILCEAAGRVGVPASEARRTAMSGLKTGSGR